jgi:hypothetical protein
LAPAWSDIPAGMQTISLHLGTGPALADLVPDNKHAGMWRIRWPDGQASDMANIDRAKDAGKAIAARKLSTPTSVFSAARLKWRTEDRAQDSEEIAPAASPVS